MFFPSLDGQAARPPRRFWPLPLVLLFGFLVSVTGCGGCSSKTPTSTSSEPKTSSPAASGWDTLDPALAMMQPETLGVRADPHQATGLLNQWRTVQKEAAKNDPGKGPFIEPISEETRKLLEKGLSPEAAKNAAREEYSADDARHIRTARLMKAIVDHLAKGVPAEGPDRARVVFNYVARNMQLVSDDLALPLTPYEMLIFGEGTADDRAWVFAELLRQLNQDAVIVKPQTEFAESAPWFVGAIVEGDIHLFDPLRSTPVPASLPINLKDIVPLALADLSEPSVLDALTAGTEAELSPQMFEKVRLEIIGTSSLWSPRLAALQRFLSGEASAVVSQNLTGPSDDSSAIINRLASLESPRFSREDIHLWGHPESRLEEFARLESLSERWKPFDAPLSGNSDTGEPIPGAFSKVQLRTRTEQLMGQYREAIAVYQQIRLKHLRWASALPSDVLSIHADAAEDAYFWSAVCQMEAGGFDEAADKLAAYIKDYERFASRHVDHARILLARCLIELDRPAEAVQAISPLKPNSPEYPTAMFLRHALENGKNSQASPDSRTPNVPEAGSPEKAKPNPPAIAEKPAA